MRFGCDVFRWLFLASSSRDSFVTAVVTVLSAFLQGVTRFDLARMSSSAGGEPLFAVAFVVLFHVHTLSYSAYLAGRFTFSFLQVGGERRRGLVCGRARGLCARARIVSRCLKWFCCCFVVVVVGGGGV